MVQLVLRLWRLLPRRCRSGFLYSIPAKFLSSFVELVTLGCFAFVLTVLVRPEEQTHFQQWPAAKFAIQQLSEHSAIYFLTGLALIALVLNELLALSTNQLRFRNLEETRIWLLNRLHESYLSRDFVWFLQKSPAELKQDVVGRVQILTKSVIEGCYVFIGSAATALVLGAALFYIDWSSTVLGLAVITLPQVTIYLKMSPHIESWSKKQRQLKKELVRKIDGTFAMTKELKVYGLEATSASRVSLLQQRMKTISIRQNLASQVTTRSLRLLFLTSVLLLVMLVRQLANFGGLTYLILYFGLLLRLVGTISKAISAFYSVLFERPFLEDLLPELEYRSRPNTEAEFTDFKGRVEFRDVAFRHGVERNPVFESLNFHWELRGTTVLLGPTGIGKTTLVDLLIGLLKPTKGEISLDGRPLQEFQSSWQACLGYVSQDHPLMEASVAENIAASMPGHELDLERVRRVAGLACILDELESEPEGLSLQITEDGREVSRGQKQRIALARALYRQPLLLVLDEATSHLDGETERRILDNLKKVPDLKILLVTHRTRNISPEDSVFELFRDESNLVRIRRMSECEPRCPAGSSLIDKLSPDLLSERAP